jgi:hypothetical protein
LSALIFAHSPKVRASRRKASRAVRIMTRNIKQAAARQGLTSIPALSLAAGVPLRRTARMWFGIGLNVDEIASYMDCLGLTVADVFAGTRDDA